MNENKILSLTTLSSLDLIVKTVFEMAVLVIVTNVFGTEIVGQIGISTGIFIFIAYLAFSPETYLLKEINLVTKNLGFYYNAFSMFWKIRFLFLIFVAFLITFYLKFYSSGDLYKIFLVIATIQILKIYQQSIYEFYYVTYKQKHIVIMGIFFKIIFTISLFSLFLFPKINLFLFLYLISFLFPLLYWLNDSKKRFGMKDEKATIGDLKVIYKELKDFSIWDHLIKSSLNALYRIDTFILYFFLSPLSIGYYTIALNIANYFQIIPQFFQKALIVTFDKDNDNQRLMMKSLIINFILNLVQITTYYFLGKYVISILFATDSEKVFEISMYLIIGISIFNLARPIQSLLINTTSMKSLFLIVYMPAVSISIILFVLMTSTFGIIGALISKVASFLLLSILLIFLQNKISK